MSLWSQFEQIPCQIEGCQCEAPRDAFIRQPSSFWSSFSYLIIAIILFNQIKVRPFKFKLWVGTSALVGLSSLICHGSFTRLGLAIDFSSIILMLSFFVTLRFCEKRKFTPSMILFFLMGQYGVILTAMYSLGKWYKLAICAVIFFIALIDIIRTMRSSLFKEKMLSLSFTSSVFALVFFILDELHIGCYPDSLFQWHSIWHIGTSISLYFYGLWRFPPLTGDRF